MKRKLLSMALAFVLVFAAGCGKSGGEGAAEPADNAPAAEEAEAEAPEESGTEDAAGESFSVGFALRTANGSYYAAIGEVVKAKCEELGWECTILDANNDTTKELENMESLAASGVDLIFLDCVDPSAATASQKVAADAGIPLINLDSGVDDMSMQITTVYSNNEQNGLEVGKYYAATLADDFEISAVMLSGNTGSIAGTQRRDGMFAGIIMERTGCTEEEAWTAAEEMEASLVSTGKASNADAKFTIT